jgi:UDP-N-acetylmuramate--alanine ligase
VLAPAAPVVAAARRFSPGSALDLSTPRTLHVVGVGGPGMSAIAITLAEMGHRVSGSDLRDHAVLERVRAAGVDVHVGHDRRLVHGVDAVTFSSAVPTRNIEIVEAFDTGVPVMQRSGMLAAICAQASAVAVAGTHGKTTTTSMLMLILAEAGLQPSFIVGGDVTDVGTGAHWSGHRWLVVEADESDGTHEALPLFGSIVTNIDVDHLDHYGSFEAIVDSFDRYLGRLDGPRVVCADSPVAARVAARHGATTYGVHPDADVRAVDVQPSAGAMRFDIERRRHDGGSHQHVLSVALPLRGLHNVANATGAAAMALELGVGPGPIAAALSRFGGVARRFDIRGTDGGATFVDDYAHIPTEIAAVLTAARDSGDGWSRVVAVFQPNRYHRIATLWPDYADAFDAADLIVLTDIYASGTAPIPGVTGKLIVDAVAAGRPDRRVVWLPRRRDLVEFLRREVRAGDVCISMGCGDIAMLPDEVILARRRR